MDLIGIISMENYSLIIKSSVLLNHNTVDDHCINWPV